MSDAQMWQKAGAAGAALKAGAKLGAKMGAPRRRAGR